MPNPAPSRRPKDESIKGKKLSDVLRDLDKCAELAWNEKNPNPKQDIWQAFGPIVWFLNAEVLALFYIFFEKIYNRKLKEYLRFI